MDGYLLLYINQKLFSRAGDAHHTMHYFKGTLRNLQKTVQHTYSRAMVYCLEDSRCSLNLCPLDMPLWYKRVSVIQNSALDFSQNLEDDPINVL